MTARAEGAVEGWSVADCQQGMCGMPPKAVEPAITGKGFDAIWVDRRGCPIRVAPLESVFARLADDAPLVNHDERYAVHKFVRFRQRLKEQSP